MEAQSHVTLRRLWGEMQGAPRGSPHARRRTARCDTEQQTCARTKRASWRTAGAAVGVTATTDLSAGGLTLTTTEGRKRVEEAGTRGGATVNETTEAMSDSAGTMGGTTVGAMRRGVMIGAGTIGVVATAESARTTADVIATEGARQTGRAEAAAPGTA